MASIDLHFHSRASDGALSPTEVIRRAHGRSASLVALTDHDCLTGLAEARAEARALALPFLNGVEVSVSWGVKAQTVHIVGLGFDSDDPVLLAGLDAVRQGRIERAREMAAQLARVGIDGAFEGAMAVCDNPEQVSRTHFARFLVEQGHVKDVRTVFRKYLTPGKPGYVPHHWAALADAVGWIVGAGGVAVIAHPGRYDLGRTLTERLINEFKAAGGEGIEVASGSHSLDDLHKYALIAQRYDLWSSAGSDFHAPGEGGRDVGVTDDLPPICRPVWELLADRVQA
ncbi:3',5'-nucleoside bisphosphate phosphatase [Paludibacterium sp.]|uniref:3',5'-nucleoside bisphosphate phosphatase n=1 Tax=Paludibacterium sp. TaxID=1917523 RepID=UPI0025FCFAEE|nr:3',5'-nucleoside bisphosphate phosphatase [Paludibacterium sp.]MBV8649208.1 PHP domain-containing protein [Paludibacterium sp.]